MLSTYSVPYFERYLKVTIALKLHGCSVYGFYAKAVPTSLCACLNKFCFLIGLDQ